MKRWRNEEYPLAKQPAILALVTFRGIQHRRVHMFASTIMAPEDRLRDTRGARRMTGELVFHRCSVNQGLTSQLESLQQLLGKSWRTQNEHILC